MGFFKADTFTINPAWVKEMCELIIGSRIYGKIEFTANSRVRPLSKETLELMKKAGCLEWKKSLPSTDFSSSFSSLQVSYIGVP